MKSVIRQEWKMRSRTIAWVSGILAILNIIMIISNGIAIINPTSKTRFAANMMMSISAIIDTFGILGWTILKGAGNMQTMLFGDTGYLFMTLPKKSYILLIGKTLVGLIEFVIYAFQSCVYMLVLLAQSGGKMIDETDVEIIADGVAMSSAGGDPIIGDVIAGNGFFGRLGTILNHLFTEHLTDLLNAIGLCIVVFILIQIVINCAMTVYASFCKNRRFSKLLMVLILFFLMWISIKITGSVLDVAHFRITENIAQLWVPVGIFTLFGAVYFTGTFLLYEKRVSL